MNIGLFHSYLSLPKAIHATIVIFFNSPGFHGPHPIPTAQKQRTHFFFALSRSESCDSSTSWRPMSSNGLTKKERLVTRASPALGTAHSNGSSEHHLIGDSIVQLSLMMFQVSMANVYNPL